MNLIVSATSEGLLWGLMALGVFLTFRVLDLPDMTAEGSFPLGAAICVHFITQGVSPVLATLLAMISGMIAGFITGFFITRCHIPRLLAGILTMTGLYSINLRVLGRANLSLLKQNRIFDSLSSFQLPPQFDRIFMGISLVVLLITLLAFFYQTELGQGLIATGDNEQMARSLGVNTDFMKMLGLMLSNGLIAFSGAMVAQSNGYADVNMGIGTIVIGLASVIIGEVVFGNLSLTNRLICVVLGSIIYRFIILIVISIGMNPNDLKLISALLLAICLSVPTLRTKLKLGNFFSKEVNKHE